MKKNIKLLLLLLSVFLLSSSITYAKGYRYQDGALIYTNVKIPDTVANNVNNSKNIDLNSLKKGESYSRNVLGLIDIGDAGVNKAMQNGNIKTLYYADTEISKVYVPLLFIPIYMKEYKTIVYGE